MSQAFGNPLTDLCDSIAEGFGISEKARERIYLEESRKRNAARVGFYRERDGLLEEIRERGFIANVTLDGSIIVVGMRS